MDVELFQDRWLKRPLLHCIAVFLLSEISGVYFLTLNSVALIYLTVLLPIPHCLAYCSFIISLDVEC